MNDRERRIALNEALFRQVNEAVSEISGESESPDFEIVCECGNLSCGERIHITSAAYSALRSESHQFAVLPGHEIPDVEDLISDQGEYYIVRKTSPEARELAERTDPN
jgi:hypothetical protein